jgi:hypothetical protein
MCCVGPSFSFSGGKQVGRFRVNVHVSVSHAVDSAVSISIAFNCIEGGGWSVLV